MNEQNTSTVPARSPRPSTPPFLNIASPDFKNFKAFLRSPTTKTDQASSIFSSNPPTSSSNASESDELLGQISELDFESAYALLTKSPLPLDTANTPPLSSFTAALHQPSSSSSNFPQLPQPSHSFHQFAQLQSPRSAAFFAPENNDFKPMFFQQPSPSPKMMSPIIDLETLAYFNNPSPGQSEFLGHPVLDQQQNELLSVNESNALEQFLDSIIDDQIKEKKIPKQENLKNAIPALQEHLQPYEHETQRLSGLGVSTSEEPSTLGTPLSLSSSIRLENDTQQDQASSAQSRKRERKKRKLLSEEEKKFNHTSSEQRRRGLIKDAFDDLVKLLPLDKDPNSRRKNYPKSVILDKTASEIERIEKINNELRKLIESNDA